MRSSWTRRRFLGVTVGGSLASRVTSAAPPVETGAFTPVQRAGLRAFMDEIIPAGDGMPAASEVGAMEYLETLASKDPGPRRDLADCVAAVDRSARSRLGKGFVQLTGSQRSRILTETERDNAKLFQAARDLVYEAYYTRPAVWKRLGYEFRPADQPGPALDVFDERLLERVKGMGTLYRKVE